MRVYNKLVRDKISEIIRANGETPETEVLGGKRYLEELHKKLFEEANEFVEEDSIEELADLMEAIYSIAKAKNINWDEMEKMRISKAESRGAFEQKIFLKNVK